MASPLPPMPFEASSDRVLLKVKVVPGASKTKIAGLLGDRLKVLVAVPPENGLANKVLCELLAEAFGLPKRDVRIAEGQSRPRKSIELLGLTLGDASDRLRRLLQGGTTKL